MEMNRSTKILIVLFCVSLCGAGTFITSNARKEREPRKTNAIPVKNRDVVRRIWIQV